MSKKNPKLVIIQNHQIKEKFELKDLINKIGSKSDNDIILADKRVSSYHAEIKYESQHYRVVDKNSTNGIIVNNKKIQSGIYHVLNDNDEIKIGKVTMIYKENDDNNSNSSTYFSKDFKQMDSITVHASMLQQHLSSYMGNKTTESEIDLIQSSVNKLKTEITGLENSYSKLSLLYQISQELNNEFDLKKLLNLIIDQVIINMNAERGFIMLYDKKNRLVPAIARGINLNDGKSFAFSKTIANEVAKSKDAVITKDAQHDERYNSEQSIIGYNLRSIMCAPLLCKGDVKGVIYIDNSNKVNIFNDDDLELLKAISSQAAMAIVNATLYKRSVEKKKYEKELELAHNIQMNLLPKSCPIIENINIAAKCRPAKMVGGDYYDFLNSRLGDNILGVIIADVSGKGVPASMIVTMTRSILRTAYENNPEPVDTLNKVNYHLIRELAGGGMFVTMFLATIDIITKKMTYAKAGHNPPIIYNKNNNEIKELNLTGLPCGMFLEGNYETNSIQLKEGDRVILYTDGITEAQNSKNELFGTEKLIEIVKNSNEINTKRLLDKIYHEVKKFSDKKQFDDETMIIIDIVG